VRPGGDKLYVVAGDWLYELDATFGGALVGTLLRPNSGAVSITDNGSSVYLADGVNRYYYTWATGTFAIIADGAFTGGDRGRDRQLHHLHQGGLQPVGRHLRRRGDLERAFLRPQGLRARQHRRLHGEQARGFHPRRDDLRSVGGRGAFPVPVPEAAGHQHAARLRREKLRRTPGRELRLPLERRPGAIGRGADERVSPDAHLDARGGVDIQSYSTVSDAVGFSYQQSGHEFYVLTFPTADKTWCYDLATGLWHRRARRDSGNVLHRDRANCAVPSSRASTWSGITRTASSTPPRSPRSPITSTLGGSAGGYIPRIRRCRHLTDDLKHVYHHDLQIQFQPGVGLITGTGDDPQAALKWSDDGGFTWSGPRFAAIGKIGEYKNRCIWRALGRSRDRIYEVTVTDPVYPVIVSANLNTSQGAS
jgi:hypothetical protein